MSAFAAWGEPFEWKWHAHDAPAELVERLEAAGFLPEEAETVMVGRVEEIAAESRPPEGVALREVEEHDDLGRIEAMEDLVWGREPNRLADRLAAERALDPEGLTIVVAEAAGTVISAGWVRFEAGTEFATLWGGATLPAWRGRGVYRSLVARRAALAARRGFHYLEVDASDASRSILERLGFVAVAMTAPFIWSPSAHAGGGRR